MVELWFNHIAISLHVSGLGLHDILEFRVSGLRFRGLIKLGVTFKRVGRVRYNSQL